MDDITANLIGISRRMRKLGEEIPKKYGIGSEIWNRYNFAVIDLDALVDAVPGAREEVLREIE